MIDDKRIEKIAEHYGFDKQCDKLIEEMSELMVAITHMKKKDENYVNHFENFIEELGDVEIIVSQLEHLLRESDRAALKESIEFKIKRELKRLSIENSDNNDVYPDIDVVGIFNEVST